MVLKKYLLLITLFTFTLNISAIPCLANNPYDDEERGTSSSTQRLILEDEKKPSYGSTAHHQVNNDEECTSCWSICGGLFMIGTCAGLVIYLLAHLKLSH